MLERGIEGGGHDDFTLAAGELGELFQEGGLSAVEHAEGEQDVLGEVALGKLRAGRLSDCLLYTSVAPPASTVPPPSPPTASKIRL